MTDRISRIHQVVEAPAPRWMFEAGVTEATREMLAILCHEADEQMVHLQYYHLPSQAEEWSKAMVVPARDHDRMGCFTD
jgi:hypothetical protein